MLTLRLIAPNDYTVHEDGQLIGRIRYTRERSPGLWMWTCVVTLPGAPFGDASTLDDAKERFKAAWLTFKAKHTAEQLAQTYTEMNHANRPGRYRR
ncbi:hypothetical protein [Bradyrhizobium ottawaense]|uniref:hypothetical protein n=1 Tax=Bradyrhizobium ottawaense TaxID=931866 RepID=UPI001BAABEDD|nr:hypothetical protein [Bradyrhizobium ottawaense]MBR1290128.1 hypothetical protein [Bradyrhizobium ottawaense]